MITYPDEKCKSCSTNKRPAGLKRIGDDVLVPGGRDGDTRYSYQQCQDCGSIWQTIKDIGGLGGNGTFHKQIS